MRKFNIDFMGNRNRLFADLRHRCWSSPSRALAVRGLNFGIEFKGGTVIHARRQAGRDRRRRSATRSQKAGVADAQSSRPSTNGVAASSCAPRVATPRRPTRRTTKVATDAGPAAARAARSRRSARAGARTSPNARAARARRSRSPRSCSTSRSGSSTRCRSPRSSRWCTTSSITLGIYALARLGGHAEHRRRAADDPRLLALRHDRRVPPHQGELAGPRQAVVHEHGERVDQRGARCARSTRR